jgi:anthranilate phosphoribosyltransferase
VLLNAGAAIYVAGIAGSLAEGIGRAREVVASGAARAALDRLRKATASIS